MDFLSRLKMSKLIAFIRLQFKFPYLFSNIIMGLFFIGLYVCFYSKGFKSILEATIIALILIFCFMLCWILNLLIKYLNDEVDELV